MCIQKRTITVGMYMTEMLDSPKVPMVEISVMANQMVDRLILIL